MVLILGPTLLPGNEINKILQRLLVFNGGVRYGAFERRGRVLIVNHLI